jgi:hypothetical protein
MVNSKPEHSPFHPAYSDGQSSSSTANTRQMRYSRGFKLTLGLCSLRARRAESPALLECFYVLFFLPFWKLTYVECVYDATELYVKMMSKGHHLLYEPGCAAPCVGCLRKKSPA